MCRNQTLSQTTLNSDEELYSKQGKRLQLNLVNHAFEKLNSLLFIEIKFGINFPLIKTGTAISPKNCASKRRTKSQAEGQECCTAASATRLADS